LKNSPKRLFNGIQGVINPSTNPRSSIVGRPERSNFLRDASQAAANEFFNRIGQKQTVDRHPELLRYGDHVSRSVSGQIRQIFALSGLSPKAAEFARPIVMRGVWRDTFSFRNCPKGRFIIAAVLFSNLVEEYDSSCPSAMTILATTFAE
jgi:hypothetical protein